jgi:hypothetical protein
MEVDESVTISDGATSLRSLRACVHLKGAKSIQEEDCTVRNNATRNLEK